MKPLIKLILIFILCICFSVLKVQAQNESITFTWKVGKESNKSFSIQATQGKIFLVNWGDGKDTLCNGNGTTDMEIKHTYTYPSSYSVTITGTMLDCLLTSFHCSYNELSNLDVRKSRALISLDCSNNQLTSLDLSKNMALKKLRCSYNQLSGLDVTMNTMLIELACYRNGLNKLDVSKNIGLKYLYCLNNQLSSLDVTKNSALIELKCEDNRINNLDVSKNFVLTGLSCNSNQLKNLDVTKNLDLTYLKCGYNRISNLDVSKNIALVELSCNSNQLKNLDITKNTALVELQCCSNAIPLADVYATSQKVINVEYKHLGTQKLPVVHTILNTSIPLDTVFHGKGTMIAVTNENVIAIAGTDYVMKAGNIVFKKEGRYIIEITNPAITSNKTFPAKIVASYIVGNVPDDKSKIKNQHSNIIK